MVISVTDDHTLSHHDCDAALYFVTQQSLYISEGDI